MNKIKEALEISLEGLTKYSIINHENELRDKLLITQEANNEFITLQSSLSKLLGEMDEFDYTYGENIFHISGKARDKFLDIYNKLDLIIQGKSAYKIEEKKE